MLVYLSFKWSLIVLVLAFILGKVFRNRSKNSMLLNVLDIISLGTGRMLRPDGIEGTLMFLGGNVFAFMMKLLVLSLLNYPEWVGILTFLIFSLYFVWYVQERLPIDRVEFQQQKEEKQEKNKQKGMSVDEITKEGLEIVKQKVRYQDKYSEYSHYEPNPYDEDSIYGSREEKLRAFFAEEDKANERYEKDIDELKERDQEGFDLIREEQQDWIEREVDREFQDTINDQSLHN